MVSEPNAIYVQNIVIGGGQAGLAVGYLLAKRKLPFVILDANAQVGDAWRKRWDSLRLFTPARHVSLPGMRINMSGSQFPTKDQIADYLRDYALRFKLPVRNNVRVDRLWKENGRYQIKAGPQRFEADNVIVAMSNYQDPKVPAFAADLDSSIVQLHSHHYHNPSQLQFGRVLVVGVGNSGGDIALEVAKTHPTSIAGKESGAIPWPIDTFFARHIAFRFIAFLGHHILTVKTPIGRKARPKLLRQAAPLIRVKPSDFDKSVIERLPRVVGVKSGLPLLEDGRILEVTNVIWCTGYQHGFPWIDLPVFENDGLGDPIHENGISNQPGLYFVGLHFLYAMSSASLVGVSRDADRIVKSVAARVKEMKSASKLRQLIPASAREAKAS